MKELLRLMYLIIAILSLSACGDKPIDKEIKSETKKTASVSEDKFLKEKSEFHLKYEKGIESLDRNIEMLDNRLNNESSEIKAEAKNKFTTAKNRMMELREELIVELNEVERQTVESWSTFEKESSQGWEKRKREWKVLKSEVKQDIKEE